MLSVQVNFHTIIKNVNLIKKQLHPGTKFCAVVKANAYGLGLELISKLLLPLVDCFAVADMNDAIKLRQIGIKHDILLLGICENIDEAVQHNLIITVENTAQAHRIIQQKLHPRIHLAVNTGMNRFGLNSVHELRATLLALRRERIEGIYTHLAYEFDHPDRVKSALNHFQKMVYICRQYFPGVTIHAGCSGVINYSPAHFNLIRIGKALYGGTKETQTAITVTSQIIAVKKLKPGATIGYNGTYTTKQPTMIGIVRGGYANGIPTQFSGKVSVLVGNQRCPIIGRVCMDCFFIDVSNIHNPLNKQVTIIAPTQGQTLFEVAQQADMITCNLLLSFTNSTSNH